MRVGASGTRDLGDRLRIDCWISPNDVIATGRSRYLYLGGGCRLKCPHALFQHQFDQPRRAMRLYVGHGPVHAPGMPRGLSQIVEYCILENTKHGVSTAKSGSGNDFGGVPGRAL